MAFSFGAAAAGAADTLQQLLAERRATALAAQQASDAEADRAFRQQQLAQQLEIARMQTDEAVARQAASTAASQLARVGTRYKEIGKQVVESTRPGEALPTEASADLLRLAEALRAGGETPVLEAGLRLGETLPARTLDLSAMAPSLGPIAGTAPADETVPATAPSLPTFSGLRMRELGVMPTVARVPTAKEQEQFDRNVALSQFGERLAQVTGGDPVAQLSGLGAITATIGQYPEPLQPELRGMVTAARLAAQADIGVAQNRQTEARLEAMAAPLIEDRERRQAEMRAYDQMTPDQQFVADRIGAFTPQANRGRSLQDLGTAAQRSPAAFNQAAQTQILASRATAATERAAVKGRADALKALTELGSVIATLDSNLVSGTLENVLGRLGTMKDPKLVSARNKILALTQSYRAATTGKAFSQGETQEYKTLLPDITNLRTLNVAKVRDVGEAFARAQNSFWNATVGEDVADLIGARTKFRIVLSTNPDAR